MAKIRVLRLLEYTYDSVEQMDKDMALWQVPANGQHLHGRLKSATLPLTILKDDDNAPED